MRFLTLSCVGLSFVAASNAMATPSQTAQVSDFSGKILVSHGKGFNKAAANLALKTGDSIFIGNNSSVTIAFETAQCSVTYSTPQTLVVPAKAPCTAGQALGKTADLTVEPANFRHFASFGANSSGGASSWIGFGFFGATFATAVYQQCIHPASAP
jgi:hypothetical protein